MIVLCLQLPSPWEIVTELLVCVNIGGILEMKESSIDSYLILVFYSLRENINKSL